MQNARRRMSVGLIQPHKNLCFRSADSNANHPELDSDLGFAVSNLQSLFNVLRLANSCHDIFTVTLETVEGPTLNTVYTL
jgi:hypothetical protein